MTVELWMLVFAAIGAVVAIGGLIARDHETPIRILVRRHRWFVLASFVGPLALAIVVVNVPLPGPAYGIAIGGATFLAFSLGYAYLTDEPGLVRRGLIGTLGYTSGILIASVIWPR